MVLTDGYATTGELAFYGAGPDHVAQIHERIRYASLPPPDESKLRNAPALLVLRRGYYLVFVAPFFTESTKVTTLTRQTGFHPDDDYDVILVKGYRGGLFGCGSALNQGTECK